MVDESQYSTRYYKLDCPEPDCAITFSTDGPDDRDDPVPDQTVACIIQSHEEHRVIRISPSDYEKLSVGPDVEDLPQLINGPDN
jgi:hypothetical protein